MKSIYARLRQGINAVTPYFLASPVQLLLVPSDLAVLIGRAMLSPDVPGAVKAKLLFAGLYTGAGIDLIPELFLGPIGFADDGIFVLAAITSLLTDVDPRVLKALWPGTYESLLKTTAVFVQLDRTISEHILRPLGDKLRSLIRQATAGAVQA